MMTTVAPVTTIVEQTFLRKALLETKTRTDGRTLDEMRPVKIQLESEMGSSATVQLGRTRVLAAVSCDIVRPLAHAPNEGLLSFHTLVSSLSSPPSGPSHHRSSSDQELLVSRLLEKAFKRSRAIDTEGLCIQAAEKVWQIRVDVRILDNEGNVVDCAALAAMAALLSFRRPDVSLENGSVIMHPSDEKPPIPLSIHHIPISVTFGFFSDGTVALIDPSLLEEQCHEGSMTIVQNFHGEVCALTKAGGVPIDSEKLLECLHTAGLKTARLTELLKEAVELASQKKAT